MAFAGSCHLDVDDVRKGTLSRSDFTMRLELQRSSKLHLSSTDSNLLYTGEDSRWKRISTPTVGEHRWRATLDKGRGRSPSHSPSLYHTSSSVPAMICKRGPRRISSSLVLMSSHFDDVVPANPKVFLHPR